MQRETATPVGFPVCVRHSDCEAEKDGGVKIEGGGGTCITGAHPATQQSTVPQSPALDPPAPPFDDEEKGWGPGGVRWVGWLGCGGCGGCGSSPSRGKHPGNGLRAPMTGRRSPARRSPPAPRHAVERRGEGGRGGGMTLLRANRAPKHNFGAGQLLWHDTSPSPWLTLLRVNEGPDPMTQPPNGGSRGSAYPLKPNPTAHRDACRGRRGGGRSYEPLFQTPPPPNRQIAFPSLRRTGAGKSQAQSNESVAKSVFTRRQSVSIGTTLFDAHTPGHDPEIRRRPRKLFAGNLEGEDGVGVGGGFGGSMDGID